MHVGGWGGGAHTHCYYTKIYLNFQKPHTIVPTLGRKACQYFYLKHTPPTPQIYISHASTLQPDSSAVPTAHEPRLHAQSEGCSSKQAPQTNCLL